MLLFTYCLLYVKITNILLDYHIDVSHSRSENLCAKQINRDSDQEGSPDYKVVCYFASGSVRAPGQGRFLPEDIDVSLCTHINFAFANISEGVLSPYDPDDVSTAGKKGFYERLTDLKKKKPTLKVLLSVGGWGMLAPPWTQVAATAKSRTRFAEDAVQYLTRWNFDGLDVDWEFPTERGSPPEDKHRFTLLMKEIRKQFDGQKSGEEKYLLSSAVSARRSDVDAAYEVAPLSGYLDYFNLMAYDLHCYRCGDNTTGLHSPLYPPAAHPDADSQDTAVKYWLEKGAPREKLVLGLGLYGRSFTLRDPGCHHLDCPAIAPGQPGNGFIAYRQIARQVDDGWPVVWCDHEKSFYSYSGDQWVGFDNNRSMEIKCQYVRDHGLGGAMVWSLDQDDFSGAASGGQKYPLLTAINKVLTPSGDTVLTPSE